MKKAPTDFISGLLKEMEKEKPFNEKEKKGTSVKFEDVDDDFEVEDEDEEEIPKSKTQKKPISKSPVEKKKEKAAPKKPTQTPTAKLFDSDMDLKTIDLLTQKLIQEMGGDFGDDDEDDEDDLDDDTELQKQLFQEFRNLNAANKTGAPSKGRLKQLYLQLLQSGPALMKEKQTADQFLAKLNPTEMTAIIDILQKEPDDVIAFFNNDPQVIEAIKNTPSLSTKKKSGTTLWQDLKEEDLEDSDDENGDAREKASEAVKETLKVFEENLVHYAQNPGKLMQLSNTLSDRDQHIFLDILFKEYTPDKMNKRLKEIQESGEKETKPVAPQIDHDLVAQVFRQVLSHFGAYKKHPHKFKPLLDRLNPLETEALEALVRAFWDITPDQLQKL